MRKSGWWLLAVAAAMVLSGPALFASGQKEAGGTSAAAQVPVINYLINYEPGYELKSDSEAVVLWGQKTGVKFAITNPPRDNFADKVTIALASGELPDMIHFFRDAVSHKKYGPQLFFPLDVAMKEGKLPNLQKWFTKYPITFDTMVAGDGHVYGFPGFTDAVWPANMMWTRGDLLRKGGIDANKIDTLDDMKRAIKAVKDNAGHDFIVYNRHGVSYFLGMTQPFFGIAETLYFDDTPGGANKFVFAPALDRYRAYVEFCKFMFDNKILYTDWATMTDDELDMFFGEQKFKWGFDAPNGFTDYDARFWTDLPADANAVRVLPPKINGIRYAVRTSSPVSIGWRYPVVIIKSSKVADAALRAMDWAYSEEGYLTLKWGPENRWWSRDASYPSGFRFNVEQVTKDGVSMPQIDQWAAKNNKKSEELYPNGAKDALAWGYGPYLSPITTKQERMFETPFLPDQKDLANIVPESIDFYVKNGAVKDPEPIVVLTQDEINESANLRTALNTYIEENLMKFINGIQPMSNWDSFVAGAKRLGSERLPAIYNAALARKTANK